MAFTDNDMTVFSARVQQFMGSLQNLREEAARLDAIYTNEALSGSDPQWADTTIATASEHVEAINLFRDLKSFIENGTPAQSDRGQTMTPFLQGNN